MDSKSQSVLFHGIHFLGIEYLMNFKYRMNYNIALKSYVDHTCYISQKNIFEVMRIISIEPQYGQFLAL